jgi:hypothetical protein
MHVNFGFFLCNRQSCFFEPDQHDRQSKPACQCFHCRLGKSILCRSIGYLHGINGGSTPGYQWKVNGVNAGTSQNTYSYVPVNGDIVTCLLTSTAPCPISNPVTSNAITMSVLQVLPVSITISTMTNPSCTGSQVTFTATASNGGTSPHYQGKKMGSMQGQIAHFSYISRSMEM